MNLQNKKKRTMDKAIESVNKKTCARIGCNNTSTGYCSTCKHTTYCSFDCKEKDSEHHSKYVCSRLKDSECN